VRWIGIHPFRCTTDADFEKDVRSNGFGRTLKWFGARGITAGFFVVTLGPEDAVSTTWVAAMEIVGLFGVVAVWTAAAGTGPVTNDWTGTGAAVIDVLD